MFCREYPYCNDIEECNSKIYTKYEKETLKYHTT